MKKYIFVSAMKKWLYVFLLSLLSVNIAFSYPVQSLNHKLQQVISNARVESGVSALSVSIILPGETIPRNFLSGKTQEVYGFPITTSNLLQIGSNTKSFTAAAILQLVAQGKLSLDENLGKLFPQYLQWRNVTVRQLLSNSSGIYNYSLSPEFVSAVMKRKNYVWHASELINFSLQHKMDFKPGEGWKYSNTNFILAGMIIHKITGKSVKEYFDAHFLGADNLNLLNTYYYPDGVPYVVAVRMVRGYNDEGYDITLGNMSWAGAAGGIIANAEDLARWAYVLFKGRALPPKMLKEMMTVVSVKTGKPISDLTQEPEGYGLGIGTKILPVGRYWGHKGTTMGYHSLFAWFPKQDIIISIVVNRTEIDLDDIATKIIQTIGSKTAGSLKKKSQVSVSRRG